jgi:hypothetical protein
VDQEAVKSVHLFKAKVVHLVEESFWYMKHKAHQKSSIFNFQDD